MQGPPTSYVVQREDQLAALLHVRYGGHLLAQFRDGATASEAARKLGEPAPRVHYHVRRLCTLGLLVPEAGGQGRRLRPVAERFVVAPELRGLVHRGMVQPFLQTLTNAFLDSAGPELADHPPDAVLLDLRSGDADPPPASPSPGAPRALVRMVRLTPAAFDRVCAEVWARVSAEEKAGAGTKGARYFTLSLLGFPGTMLPLAETDADPERPLHAE